MALSRDHYKTGRNRQQGRAQSSLRQLRERVSGIIERAREDGSDSAYEDADRQLSDLRAELTALAEEPGIDGNLRTQITNMTDDLEAMTTDVDERTPEQARRADALWGNGGRGGEEIGIDYDAEDNPDDDEDAPDDEDGGDGMVRAHERNGKPVRAYRRGKTADDVDRKNARRSSAEAYRAGASDSYDDDAEGELVELYDWVEANAIEVERGRAEATPEMLAEAEDALARIEELERAGTYDRYASEAARNFVALLRGGGKAAGRHERKGAAVARTAPGAHRLYA